MNEINDAGPVMPFDDELDDQDYDYFQNIEDMVATIKGKKREARRKLYKQVENAKMVTNIFSVGAEKVEIFLQNFKEMVESVDQTVGWVCPRDPFVVNEEFKPKTTKDLGSMALLWFLLLNHFGMKFEDIVTSDESKHEFIKLMVNLRANEKTEAILTQMIKFAGGHLALKGEPNAAIFEAQPGEDAQAKLARVIVLVEESSLKFDMDGKVYMVGDVIEFH